MLNTIVSRLRGEVRVRVTAAFPERVLNLCGARGLHFWDVTWNSPQCFSCTLSRADAAALRRAAEKLECDLLVERRRGAPFFFHRLRRRYVLLAGAALCALALLYGSFFIWDFTVDGNTAVSDETILRALQRYGVDIGTFGLSLDPEDLRNHVLLELPQLSWITVNVSGCQAHVLVRERIPRPELADKRTPRNIVARRDGLILKMSALNGTAAVLPGTTAEAGQLLISGIRDTDTFGSSLSAGIGSVTARTWYTLRTELPLTAAQKCYAEKERTCLSLIFGTHRIKIYGNSGGWEGNYDKITVRTKLRLLGVPLPVTAERETCRPYTVRQITRTPARTQLRAEALLTEYLHTLVDSHGTVSSTLCAAKQTGDILTVTLRAECVEQIGIPAPILTEQTGTPQEKH